MLQFWCNLWNKFWERQLWDQYEEQDAVIQNSTCKYLYSNFYLFYVFSQASQLCQLINSQIEELSKATTLLLNITIMTTGWMYREYEGNHGSFPIVNMFNQLLGYVLPKMLLKYKTNCSHGWFVYQFFSCRKQEKLHLPQRRWYDLIYNNIIF